MYVIKTELYFNEKEKHAQKIYDFLENDIKNLQLKAGQTIPAHHAKTNILIIVRRGKVLFEVNGEKVEMTNQKILHLAPHENHQLEAIEDTDIVIIKLSE